MSLLEKIGNGGGCAHGRMWVIAVGVAQSLSDSGFMELRRDTLHASVAAW